jgi:hypothetical protein
VTTTGTGTVGTVAVVAPTAPAPVSGPAPMTNDSQPQLLAAPVVNAPAEDTEWNYTVSGTITAPNPGSFTVTITVDGATEPAAKVTAVLDSSGNPTNAGNFTTTFGLAPCYSATDCTRYCTAVVTNASGTAASAVANFTIEQTPRPQP